MEGSFLINFFAFMGGLSLYVVIATIVGRAIYSRTQGWEKDTRCAAAIFCGILFPISVPITILVIWIMSIINVPLGNDEEQRTDEKIQRLDVVERRIMDLEEMESVVEDTEPKTKFKVGDLITGVKENPAGYKHLYEGCICRVLKTNGNKAMDVILIDHIDQKAQEDCIGNTFKAPPRYFTLVKQESSTKKVAKKRKR